jgi:hypothetical protein
MDRRGIDSDFWVTSLTNLVLVGLGILCIFGMFYYRAASVRPDWDVINYQMMMNRLASPMVILLCLLLVVCVPKRMLPGRWLALAAGLLLAGVLAMALLWGFLMALVLTLMASLGFQLVTFGLLLAGRKMHFRKSGLWMPVGSILIHTGFILFIMDFAMLHQTRWHLMVFWASTFSITAGCLLSFYAPRVDRFIDTLSGGGDRPSAPRQEG